MCVVGWCETLDGLGWYRHLLIAYNAHIRALTLLPAKWLREGGPAPEHPHCPFPVSHTDTCEHACIHTPTLSHACTNMNPSGTGDDPQAAKLVDAGECSVFIRNKRVHTHMHANAKPHRVFRARRCQRRGQVRCMHAMPQCTLHPVVVSHGQCLPSGLQVCSAPPPPVPRAPPPDSQPPDLRHCHHLLLGGKPGIRVVLPARHLLQGGPEGAEEATRCGRRVLRSCAS